MLSIVSKKLGTYYQQRVDKLKALKLNDVLPQDSAIFWLSSSASAPEVVMRLIEKHFASYEVEWREEIRDVNFCLKAIRSRDQIDERFDYERELAQAHNRITLSFINKFCKPNYSIDWEKLLHSSSKD